MDGKTIARFWAKVDKFGECWTWIGCRDSSGYGTFAVDATRSASRRFSKAHRFSWTMVHGEIPPGMLVLHRCDNPPCVNPDHLFLGTSKDNAADRDGKGRNVRLPKYSYSREEIEAIRSDREKSGATIQALSKKHGMSYGYVCAIIHLRKRIGSR